MKHFFGSVGETLEEERAALSVDIKHLQTQCARYECKEDDACDDGGVLGMMQREKRKMFHVSLDL